MSVRAKTKRRVSILIAAVLVLGATASGLYVWGKHRIVARYAHLKAEGMSAYRQAMDLMPTTAPSTAASRPATRFSALMPVAPPTTVATAVADALEAKRARLLIKAINDLGEYLGRREYAEDPEAIWGYVESRRRIPMAEEGQVRICISYLKTLIDLQPDNREAAHLQVELNMLTPQANELLDASKYLASRFPDDVLGLKGQARALSMLKKPGEGIPFAQRYVALRPEDLEVQVMLLQMYKDSNNNQEILPHAQKLLEANPASQRYELLMGCAYAIRGDLSPSERASALKLLKAAGGDEVAAAKQTVGDTVFVRFWTTMALSRPLTDASYLPLFVNMLERSGLGLEAITLVQNIDTSVDDRFLKIWLARRLWEYERFSEVDRRLSSLDPSVPGTNLELVALRAVSLFKLGRPTEAAALADGLAKRAESRVAVAWASIIREGLLSPVTPDSRRIVEDCRLALQADAGNAYLHYFMGEAYRALGEVNLATAAWSDAMALNPTWAAPLSRLASSAMERGEYDEAFAAAAGGYGRSPRSFATRAVLLQAFVPKYDQQSPEDQKQILELARDTQEKLPGEAQSLAPYVFFLSKSGKLDEARKVLDSAVATVDTPKRQPLGVLLRLAEYSRTFELGRESELYAAAEKAYGNGPDLAFGRAWEIARAGDMKGALVKLEKDASGITGDAAIAWRLGRIRLLESPLVPAAERAAYDQMALDAWKAMANDPLYQKNLGVQRSALGARTTQSDRAFIADVIERVRKLTGEDSLGWRVAKARWLLNGNSTEMVKQAIPLLTDAVARAPRDPEPRLLLSVAYAKDRNPRDAAAQLLFVVNQKPNAYAYLLDLASLLDDAGDPAAAKAQLARVPADKLDNAQRRRLASLLAHLGDYAGAQAALPTTGPVDDSQRLMQVQVARQRGDTARVDALLKEWLASPITNAVPIQLAADFYASQNRKDEARQVLARLDEVKIAAASKEIALAEFEAQWGKPDDATAHYKAGLKAEPANYRAWRNLVLSQLRNKDVTGALASAREGLAANPQDSILATVVREAADIQSLGAYEGMLPLIGALIQVPGEDDVTNTVEAIHIFAQAARDKVDIRASDDLVRRLRTLADRAPRVVPLQLAMVKIYLAAAPGKPPLPRDAAAVAGSALFKNPNNVEIAQAAAEANSYAGDWAKALDAAREWRARSAAQPMGADIMIAECQLQLRQQVDVTKTLRPYLEQAKQNPNTPDGARVLQIYVRALVSSGDTRSAQAVLDPLIADSANWRLFQIDLASRLIIASPTTAMAWLKRAEALIPPDSTAEQLSLANVYNSFGDVAKDPKMFQTARTLVDGVLAKSVTPDALFIRASIATSDHRLKDAEADYRKILSIDPAYFLAANNLAVMLSDRGELAEAMTLAQGAVEKVRGRAMSPASKASLYDTLGQIQMKSNDLPGAIKSFESAVRADPASAQWQVALASASLAAGKNADAYVAALAAREILMGNPAAPPALKARADEIIRQTEPKLTPGPTTTGTTPR